MEKIEISKEELGALVQTLVKEGLDKIIREERTDIIDIYGRTIAGRNIRIEERMATKDDIKNMATKDDIKNMATKDDIRLLAARDDSIEARMATKDDIRELKEDIRELRAEMYKLIRGERYWHTMITTMLLALFGMILKILGI